MATELVAAAESGGAETRILGGVGVALRCPSARGSAPLARRFADIDLVTTREARGALSQTLERLGYAPERRFNATHGHSRLMFDHQDGLHLDVFVDRFAMCHRLDLRARLALHDTTLPLADLLLTKVQVTELNEKDVTDAAALLLDHPLTDDEDGINVEYVTRMLARDWGWWRTVSANLRALPLILHDRRSDVSVAELTARVTRLLEIVDDAPKSLRWKARAKAGDRIPWRDEPEESH